MPLQTDGNTSAERSQKCTESPERDFNKFDVTLTVHRR